MFPVWAKGLAGALVGAGCGYLLYRFVGCRTGTCPLTSNWPISTLYGSAVGAVLGAML